MDALGDPESCLFEAFNPWSVFVNVRCRGTREAEETGFEEIIHSPCLPNRIRFAELNSSWRGISVNAG